MCVCLSLCLSAWKSSVSQISPSFIEREDSSSFSQQRINSPNPMPDESN